MYEGKLELHFPLTGQEKSEAIVSATGLRMKAFYGNYACNAFDPAHGHSLETAGWTRLNG